MAYAVVNLNGLLNTLVTEIGEYKVYKTLKHDKNHGEAVARWRGCLRTRAISVRSFASPCTVTST
jgi:hypothetical protein